ncbi:MAG: PQQ-binding-like beta-propeller repeat protein [Rickettsiales bacterium]|jgi:outer membrane protein assembly factor BamB|nr:PQQ-binding-like beta-propeller repeat protein [Rickettsiales bacterium]
MTIRRAILPLVLLVALSGCDYLPSWLGGKEPEVVRLPGDRQVVMPAATELQADETLKALPVAVPAVNPNGEWPQHSGQFDAAGGNLAGGDFASETNDKAGDGSSFERPLVPRPVVGGGLVFAMDSEGRISAHDVANIDSKRFVSEALVDDDEDINGGGLAYESGRLYAVSGRGMVAAIDAASGQTIWKKTGFAPFRSSPKVAAGKLYAITLDSQLFALDAANGETLWTHRGIDETAAFLHSVSPTAAGGTLLVPYESGEIYALATSDGRELWSGSLALSSRTQATNIFSGVGGDPVVDGDVVFAVSSGGLLAAYGIPLGQRLWEKPISSMTTPWLAGDFLYVLASDNTLLALVKYDGRVRWATKLPSFEDEEKKRRPIFWRGPVMAGGKLYLAGSRGQMKVVNSADGLIAGDIDIPDDVLTSPVIAGGTMFLVTQDAQLVALR